VIFAGYDKTMALSIHESGKSSSRILWIIFAALAPVWALIASSAYVSWHTITCFSAEPFDTSDSCHKALADRVALGPVREAIADKHVAQLRSQSKIKEAQDFLLAEIASGHDSVAREMALGDMASEESNYEEAAKFYLKAYKLDRTRTDNLGSALYSFSSASDYASAEKLVDDYLNTSPDSAYALDWKAWLKKQQQQHAEAIDLYTALIKTDPTAASYYRERADSYGRVNRFKEQLADLDKLIALEQAATNFQLRGRYHWDRANYSQALADMKTSHALEPELYRQQQIIDISLDGRFFIEANKQLQLMIKYTPDNLTTWEYACKVSVKLSDWPAASAAVEKMKQLETADYKPSLRYAAEIAEAQEDWLKAIAAYKQVIAQNDYDISARRNIGHALVELNLSGAALTWFDDVIARNPDDAENYTSRARALIRLEKWDAALADADRAISISSDWGMGYARRAQILQQQAKPQLALKDYEAALLLEPGIDWLRKDYADLLDAMGQKERAAKIRNNTE
jgi:tetratricopeptide (TPR) repeat protein